MDFQSMMMQFKNASEKASSSNEATSAKRQRINQYHDQSNLSSSNKTNKAGSKETSTPDFVSVRRYFLVCPSGAETGGPEAMHQLCDMINREGKSRGNGTLAHMIYLKERGQSVIVDRYASTPDPYKEYDAPLSSCEIFDKYDLVIWPECWTCYIDSFPDQSRNVVQKSIWWLSVNNNRSTFQKWDRVDIREHFHQSEYAREYLHRNKALAHVMEMTEFIPSRRIPLPHKVEESCRDLDVVYNPLKGMHYTDTIIQRSGKKISFTPIGGNGLRLTPDDVTNLLLRSKVFIDFGPHPGMDRMPREAALCGCIVITNRCGSAKFHADVPIPNDYKMTEADVDDIHKLLTLCVHKFEEKCRDFDSYREWIGKQETVMHECVKKMIDRIPAETSKLKKRRLISLET